jgi:cytochrome c-type biogenesis protein CcmE
MVPARKQRLIFIISLIIGVAIAFALALFALRQNINLFFTPTQVNEGLAPKNHEFRVGGIVKSGSLQYYSHTAEVEFALSDNHQQIIVFYTGILPTLFREGQGIVAEGNLDKHGDFIADQVLAKHDENYMPPEVKSELHS